jgi:hypothetical protein
VTGMPGPSRRVWNAVRHPLAVVAAYTALFTGLYARPLVEGAYLAGTDLYDYYLPIFLSPITIWSTFELAGLPAMADSQNAAFYPLNLLFGHVFSSWTGYIVSAYVLAASLTYAYVYNRTKSVLAAAVAGLAYGMSEAMLERLEHLTIVHTIAWLPLIALALDRLNGRWHPGWVAAGAFAVGNCLLAGHTQPAIYIVYACGLYALCGGVAARARPGYYAAVFALFAAGGLLAAVSAVPLYEASREAVRQTVSFGQFVSHSNTPVQMLSFFVPAIEHEGREAPTYVGLAIVVFALVSLRDWRRHWPIAFWSIVAVVSLLAGAGESTPVAGWLHDVPLYDRFRVIARHLVLAAFALAALAGFGIAAVRTRAASLRVVAVAAAVVVAALLLTVIAIRWSPDAIPLAPPSETGWSSRLPGNTVGAQLVLGVATFVICIVFAGTRTRVAGPALVLLVLVDLTTAQPYAVRWSGLQAPVVPPEALQPSVHARALRGLLEPEQQRLLAPAGVTVDPVVPGAFARLWRVPVAGAYGAIQTQRYAELAAMGTTGAVDARVLAHHDTALDLLSIRYLVMARDEFGGSTSFRKRGIEWAAARLDVPVGPEECGQQHPRMSTYALPPHVAVKHLALVTALRCSEGVVQGTPIGTVSIVGANGERHDAPLRAGIETAELSLAIPDIGRRARHQPADVFESHEGGHGYLTRVDLPRAVSGARLEFRLHGTGGWLQIHRISVLDEAGRSTPVGRPDVFLLDADRWRLARTFSTARTSDRQRDDDSPDERAIVVFENRRARPRAWLASEVVPLAERAMAMAVHHSLLPDGRTFDAARMALVDAGDEPAATFSADGAIVRTQSVAAGRIRVMVSSNGGGFLVLSESYYPGWRASIGGRQLPVRRTNLSLQGVTVPPGRHVVTFEFDSLTLRAGAAASAVTLLALTVLAASAWRRRAAEMYAAAMPLDRQTISPTSAAT